MAKVSVVMPVYNTSAYISQCIDSLLNQTLTDIEIICVDDGSTDNSVEIINSYMQKDSRVKLVQQKNCYAGVARNNGMKTACGKYIIFLDSDDFFEADMLLEMYEKIEADNADICLCSGKAYNEETGEYSPRPYYLNAERFGAEPPFSPQAVSLTLFNSVNPAPWTKLYKRSFIDEKCLKFQPLKKSNDLFFVYLSLACADVITYVDKPFVNYRIGNAQSLQGQTKLLSFDFYEALYSLKLELQKRKLFAKFEQSFVNQALSTCFYNLDRVSVKENYEIMADKLKNQYLYKLNILGHSRGYFYNKANFERIFDLMEKSSEQLWQEKAEKPVPKPKIDIDKWTSPVEIVQNGDVKVSVIIPVYNTEKYVAECIESVMNNTLKDIEIICVNDGSTDSSPEILAEYALADSRVIIVNKENGGLSSARNAGMKKAHGEYILFLDSDDYIEPRALEFLYAEAKSDSLDQLFYCAKSFYDYSCAVDYDSYYERKADYSYVMTGRRMFIIMSENAEYKPSACLQLIRRAFLNENNISFVEGILYEDNPFTIQCLFFAERVRYANINLYNRRLRADSIMTSSAGMRSSYSYYLVIKNIVRIAKECNFGKDKEFYTALINQLQRHASISSNYVSDVNDDELNEFILSLDEENGLDYYFYIKRAKDYRKSITNLSNAIKVSKEKALMDGYKERCRQLDQKEKPSEHVANKQSKSSGGKLSKIKRAVKKLL